MDKENEGEERRKENRRERRERSKRREKQKGERETKKGDFPNVSTVGAQRFEKKSRSMHRELRVGTKILEFHLTPLGREFYYLYYF